MPAIVGVGVVVVVVADICSSTMALLNAAALDANIVGIGIVAVRSAMVSRLGVTVSNTGDELSDDWDEDDGTDSVKS